MLLIFMVLYFIQSKDISWHLISVGFSGLVSAWVASFNRYKLHFYLSARQWLSAPTEIRMKEKIKIPIFVLRQVAYNQVNFCPVKQLRNLAVFWPKQNISLLWASTFSTSESVIQLEMSVWNTHTGERWSATELLIFSGRSSISWDKLFQSADKNRWSPEAYFWVYQ